MRNCCHTPTRSAAACCCWPPPPLTSMESSIRGCGLAVACLLWCPRTPCPAAMCCGPCTQPAGIQAGRGAGRQGGGHACIGMYPEVGLSASPYLRVHLRKTKRMHPPARPPTWRHHCIPLAHQVASPQRGPVGAEGRAVDVAPWVGVVGAVEGGDLGLGRVLGLAQEGGRGAPAKRAAREAVRGRGSAAGRSGGQQPVDMCDPAPPCPVPS